MTIKLSSHGGVIAVFRAGAVILVMAAGILLAGCSGLKSSTAVVSQGTANAAPVKPGNAESAILTDLHGTVEVKTGDGQWTLAQPGQTLKSGQHIRTGSMSNVAVAFYDGSRMQLGAEAQVALNAPAAPTPALVPTVVRVPVVIPVTGADLGDAHVQVAPHALGVSLGLLSLGFLSLGLGLILFAVRRK